jgi:hypothetical protein
MRYLLDNLEDPFELFPMNSVVRSLATLADESGQSRVDRMHPWSSASPKYYTVEDEHDIDVVELLIGAAFVLGQAAITQSVSLVKKIHENAGKPPWIPCEKIEIMKAAAPIEAVTGLSKIVIINAAANYHKHRYEWADDWSGPPNSKTTIEIVLKLGLSRKGDNNLERALRALEISPADMTPLSGIIGEWRENLTKQIEASLVNHHLLIAPLPEVWG